MFAQDGRRKGCMPEAKVIQNRPFIRVGRYGHFRTEWTSQKDFIYPDSQTARFLIICEKNHGKIMEKSAFIDICSTLARPIARVRLALAKTKLVCRTDFRCAHYMSNGQTAQSLYFLRKITEKSAFEHEMAA